MNIFKYLKSKYRRFISTSLDEETNYQNLDLEQSKKIANTINQYMQSEVVIPFAPSEKLIKLKKK